MSRFKHFVVVLSGLCGTYSETSKSVLLVTRLLPYVAVQYTSNKIKPLHQPALFRCNFEVTQKSRYGQRSESMKTRMRNSPDVNRKPTLCLWSKPQTKTNTAGILFQNDEQFLTIFKLFARNVRISGSLVCRDEYYLKTGFLCR